jgi:hypothetical protein
MHDGSVSAACVRGDGDCVRVCVCLSVCLFTLSQERRRIDGVWETLGPPGHSTPSRPRADSLVAASTAARRRGLMKTPSMFQTLPQHLVEVPRLLVQVPVVLLELLPQVVEVRVRPREAVEDVLRLFSRFSGVGGQPGIFAVEVGAVPPDELQVY